MRCGQCKHFVKTYEDEGWCSHPRYSGLVLMLFDPERCRGEGYVRGNEPPPRPPAAPEETPHTP